ncbi:MAG: cysteine hydrolase family protein [Cardiobacterium sp.]
MPHHSALLLIDIQQGFQNTAWWGSTRNNPQAEAVCARLLQHWRAQKLPVIHVRHASLNPQSPLHPAAPGFAFVADVAPLPGEVIITKHVNSAFIGTDLQVRLDAAGVRNLVIAGISTDHCVSTTTRMAANLGYTVRLVSDGCATFARTGYDGTCFDADTIHRTALASLHGEFAEVLESAALLAEG